MRDVQKGRKSWLERLTSPPESDDEDGFCRTTTTRSNRRWMPARLGHATPVSRRSFGPFAPPGLRPPPSDDLKSAPPERSGDLHRSRRSTPGRTPARSRPSACISTPTPATTRLSGTTSTVSPVASPSTATTSTPSSTTRHRRRPHGRCRHRRRVRPSPANPGTVLCLAPAAPTSPPRTDSPRLPSSPSGPSSQPGKSSLSGLSSASGSGVTSPAWQSEPSVGPDQAADRQARSGAELRHRPAGQRSRTDSAGHSPARLRALRRRRTLPPERGRAGRGRSQATRRRVAAPVAGHPGPDPRRPA